MSLQYQMRQAHAMTSIPRFDNMTSPSTRAIGLDLGSSERLWHWDMPPATRRRSRHKERQSQPAMGREEHVSLDRCSGESRRKQANIYISKNRPGRPYAIISQYLLELFFPIRLPSAMNFRNQTLSPTLHMVLLDIWSSKYLLHMVCLVTQYLKRGMHG